MTVASPTALSVRALLATERDSIQKILVGYAATNPRIFGSVARGDAGPMSDLDLMIDLVPGAGNALLRVAGIGEDLSRLLGIRVDVVVPELLREPVAVTARRDALPL